MSTPETKAKSILKSLVARLAYIHNVHADLDSAPTSMYGTSGGQSDFTLQLRCKNDQRSHATWYIEVKAGCGQPTLKQTTFLQHKCFMGHEAWVLWADDTKDLVMFARRFEEIVLDLRHDTYSEAKLRQFKGQPAGYLLPEILYCEAVKLPKAEGNKKAIEAVMAQVGEP